LNYLEGDYVQTLRSFADGGVDPAVALSRDSVYPRTSLALPIVRHREQQELLVPYGELKHTSTDNRK
jgi:hypothetical protein